VRLDARDALVTAIQASPSFPAGATLEVVFLRTDPNSAHMGMENRVNDERPLWQANIVGADPHEKVGVQDLRDLARELGVAVPAAAQ
jgi:hypothetical protein